jgi:hypothetical protein
MTATRIILFAALAACTSEVPFDDPDLDNDPDLKTIESDTMAEMAPIDTDLVEPMTPATVACTRTRFMHVSNFSYVGPLSQCVNGVCPNGCWGVQERTGGFACDYDSSASDFVKTRAYGSGQFASYNEIKSLNAHDATAVANCRAQSGGLRLRTYTVWNGAGWDSEGIAANVHFAELYGPQSELAPEFWTWYHGWRDRYSPMVNLSPQTGVDLVETKRIVAQACAATRNGWAGIYFYFAGEPMSDWKREAIIRGLNYCTTH